MLSVLHTFVITQISQESLSDPCIASRLVVEPDQPYAFVARRLGLFTPHSFPNFVIVEVGVDNLGRIVRETFDCKMEDVSKVVREETLVSYAEPTLERQHEDQHSCPACG
jgi:hypothetical protein